MENTRTRIGIVGYGNLGRGVELSLQQNPDLELVGIFTRRDPANLATLAPNDKVHHVSVLEDPNAAVSKEIDVLILCGGSATDLPEQAPFFAQRFNTIDSYDTHAKIPGYFDAVNAAATEGGYVSIISVGWDPGLFSVQRLYNHCILPNGTDYTFWGKGVSQGHSDAIRRIEGVANAKQYTIPIDVALDQVRSSEYPELSIREMHLRECYVVAEEGADTQAIEQEIVNMPNYFSDYETIVHFISGEELAANHGGIEHGGFVLRGGKTGVDDSSNHLIEYSLKLDSNPEFTASVLVAYARAAARLSKEGAVGARTVFDVAPAYLSPKTSRELYSTLL